MGAAPKGPHGLAVVLFIHMHPPKAVSIAALILLAILPIYGLNKPSKQKKINNSIRFFKI